MRRLFEIGTTQDPTDSDRFAYGRASNASKNITWLALKALLNSVLTFLKPSNNLSDLIDPAAARTNLSVYSITQVDSALDLKMAKSANLSDLADAATARTNLSVYSKAEIDGILISTKQLTNVGGTSSGSPNAITVDKRFINIVATNSNRFYNLPSNPTNGEEVTIKANNGNTQDVAIVTTNTDLPSDLALSQRDSIKFIAYANVWQHVAYNNSL